MLDATISCILPVFNAEDYLKEALESVLTQTRPAQEIIVVDDGSTDGSAGIVRRYGSRIKYFYEENRGPAAARNLGVARSTGKFVAFLDQDDLWHPEKLERQLACFSRQPDTDLCLSQAEFFWVAELKEEEVLYRGHGLRQKVPGYTTPAMLARRSAFDRVGPLDTRLMFADATDWFLRAIDLGLKIKLLPDVLLYHRMHDSNLTRRHEQSKEEFVRIVKSALDRRRRQAIQKTKDSET